MSPPTEVSTNEEYPVSVVIPISILLSASYAPLTVQSKLRNFFNLIGRYTTKQWRLVLYSGGNSRAIYLIAGVSYVVPMPLAQNGRRVKLLLLLLLGACFQAVNGADHDAARTGEPKFFVAVDFGTWGSGFAYSSAYDGNSIRTFEYWDGQVGLPAPKTRTALLYEPVAVGWGWSALRSYADLPESSKQNGSYALLTRFKLHLMPEDFPDAEPLPPGLTPKRVITDFLRFLFQLAHDVLTTNYGSR
jgi:hypothetical protein